MITSKQVTFLIKQSLPDALIDVNDLGCGDHLEVKVKRRDNHITSLTNELDKIKKQQHIPDYKNTHILYNFL